MRSFALFCSVLLLALPGFSQEIEFAYGLPGFVANVELVEYVDFDGVPEFTAVVEDNELATYYSIFGYGSISLQIVAANSNKPGQRRVTDLKDSGEIEYYSMYGKGGNYLIPGLGNKSNDDGVRISFSSALPITAFALEWGSMQPGSPCCIIQWFDFTFTDGTSESLRFDSGNRYMGRGTESSDTTFLGFKSSKPMASVVINQLGHNPTADNILIGRVVDPPGEEEAGPKHIVIDANDFPRPVAQPSPEPIDNIVLRRPDSPEMKVYRCMKERSCNTITRNEEIAGGFSHVAKVLYGRLKLAAATLGDTVGLYSNVVLGKECNDPPRDDYYTLAEFTGLEPTSDFADQFGEGSAKIDTLLLLLNRGIDARQQGLLTLERLQGAYIANDADAFDLQAERLELFYREADTAFVTAGSYTLDILRDLQQDDEVDAADPNVASLFRMMRELAAHLETQTFENLFTNAVFDDDFERGDLRAWGP